MRGYFAEVIGPLLLGLFIGSTFAFLIGSAIGYSHDRKIYQQCRYYNQTIERCVQELGWEKK
jgi:uncharacterized protein (DUF2062 family)